MKVKIVDSVVTTDTAGNVIDSLPVRRATGPSIGLGGYYLDAIPAEPDENGMRVRVVDALQALNSAGAPVDVWPMSGLTPIPSIDLDFMTGVLPDGVTYSRSGAATYFDSNGVMQTAASNVPRFDYDPVTHVLRGMMMEEARTNSLLRSADFSTASWVKAGGVTVSTDGTLGPDGTPMQLITLSGTSSHQILQTLSAPLTIGTKYTLTLYVMPKSTPFPFQLAYYDNSTALNGATLTPVAGIQRLTFTFTPTVAAATPQIRLIGFSNGGDGAQVYLWGAQLEAGEFPTSYIPTTSAAASCGVDIGSMLLSQPSFNPTEGTLVVEFITAAEFSAPKGAASLFSSSTNRLTLFRQGGSGEFRWFNTPGSPDRAGSTKVPAGNVVRMALAYDNAGNRALSVNGGAISTTTVTGGPDMSAFTTLGILRSFDTSAEIMSGWVRRIRYWPEKLSDAELQAMTA
jgi:hypothetical protein